MKPLRTASEQKAFSVFFSWISLSRPAANNQPLALAAPADLVVVYLFGQPLGGPTYGFGGMTVAFAAGGARSLMAVPSRMGKLYALVTAVAESGSIPTSIANESLTVTLNLAHSA